jgi:hypothetical protein
MWFFALLLGCGGPGKPDLSDTGVLDSGPGDTGDSGDSRETDDTAETDTAETDTADPDTDTAETGDTGIDVPDDTGSVEERWADFEARRDDYLLALAAVVEDCVPSQDADYPAFHGCYDWHSAVHGNYALHLVYRLTGDEHALAVAESVLTPDAIAGELELLREDRLGYEIPYGFSWFLALAAERELATGETDLLPLAEEVAPRLAEHLEGLDDNRVRGGVLAGEYGNVSWAILNLHRWAVWSGDDALADRALALARRLPDYDAELPLSADEAGTWGFFPPALHRARTILEVLPPDEAAAWADGMLDPVTITPLDPPTSTHGAGLNFSRAWGLWAVWRQTGDSHWLDLWLDHVNTHLRHPEWWAEDYDRYAHWIPQFGIYAIGMTEDGR